MAVVDISGSTILIVDDIPVNVQLVLSILTRHGYKTSFALNGMDALQSIEAAPPDLILLDIMMPGMDGYEVCRRLKNMPGYDHIPVIFLSGRAESEDTIRGFDVGAVDYVTKPFHEVELLRRVENHLRLSKAYSELEVFNMELDTRVAEKTIQLEHANRQLEQALSSTQRLERLKHDFISSVFHEFRTPMTVIQITSELMERYFTKHSDTQLVSVLTRHKSAVETLTAILNTARDFMYLQDSIVVEKPIPFVLVNDINTVLQQLQVVFPDAGSRIERLTPNLEQTTIVQKQSATNFILKELFTNALRYAKPGTPIMFGIQQEVQTLIFSFSNELEPTTVLDDSILQPFVRGAENTEMGKFRGLGLGLHLVQQCLQQMGGKLSYEYAAGTAVTFYCSFPLVHGH